MKLKIIASLCVLIVWTPTVLSAQGSAGDERPGVMPFLGFALGRSSIPGTLLPTCSEGLDGSTGVLAFEARVGLRFGNLQLESRTAYQSEYIREMCGIVPITPWSGVHTIRFPRTMSGGFRTTDVRLSYRLARENASLLFGPGIGRIWSEGVTTVLIGAGFRAGGRIQFAMDADVALYPVRWDVHTAEWNSGHVIREIMRDQFTNWKSGTSIRIGFILDVLPH
jgi:hypothetical protein